jgi:tetratricopeptide (TPR) repeat protein
VTALEEADAAEDGARLQGVPLQIGFALSSRALILELLGRGAEAEATARESLGALSSAEPSLTTRIGSALSTAILQTHDPERLLAVVAALLGPELAGVERPTSLLRTLVPAAIAAGRAGEADRWVARAEAFTARHGLPAGRVRTAVARAELLLAAGDAEPARERASAAARLADEAALALDGVRAQLALGRTAHAAGDRQGSLATLERAYSVAARAAADGLAAEAARELRAAGGRISAGALRATSLFERPRATSSAMRRSRSESVPPPPAAALFLSAKTVENNLSRIYAKLGVRTRTELARVLPPG